MEQGPLSKENEPKIEIGIAGVEDVEGIQEVFYRTWISTYPNQEFGITVEDIEDRYKGRGSEERLARRKESILTPPPGQTTFVAKEGKKVVGVCRTAKDEDKNELQALYILPEYQGRGIGSLLWHEAQESFDKEKDIVVRVATYNTNAIDVYKKFGFEDTGRRWKDEKFKMKSGAIIPEMEMEIKAKKE